ncbi:flagellar hook protein FlgE [Serpentinicella sp. ANB-PHB4]|uniref:flagellar hook protein FlgE n=1 Tax=Serpentinicella sp. ANB-PHB4 TaxID=3074076 RepID=UPI002860688D|nr:flagellar hook protein FlgE [Serpentinicella sp. ANB-PHB4]MDR5658263.1 flagellar hook protein FlgE [Serpentinicella sp. ANB-PHB4]
MMRSMFSAISGLNSHQTKMDVIGNNIANVNTVGFKGGRVTFQEVFNQTLQGAGAAQGNRGGTNPRQVGLGVSVASMDTFHVRGAVESTGYNTDAMINGDGFFIVSDDGGTTRSYTRAGNFSLDEDGSLVTPDGYKVMGYEHIGDGNFSTQLSTMQISKAETVPAQSTGTIDGEPDVGVTFTGNLNANTSSLGEYPTLPANATADNPVNIETLGESENIDITINNTQLTIDLTMVDGEELTKDILVTRINDSINDSIGEDEISVTINVDGVLTFKTSDTGEEAEINLAGDIASLGFAQNIIQENGTIDKSIGNISDNIARDTTFTVYDELGGTHDVRLAFIKTGANEYEVWQVEDDKLVKVGNDAPDDTHTIRFNEGKLADGEELVIPVGSGEDKDQPLDNGANPFNFKIDLSGITQFANESDASATRIIGYQQGNLEDFAIDATGVITGYFTNGQMRSIGQIGLAGFSNPAGLEKTGSNLYRVTSNSGDPIVGSPGTGGLGALNPGALEMSNVDLSREFTDMITTQRGFQASSRVITTSDEMLQELVNLKR